MPIYAKSIAGLLALALVAGGCYESSVPLAPQAQATAVDSSLYGIWLLDDEEGDLGLTRMQIQPYDARSYRIEFCCADVLQGRAEADLLRAHTVLVDGVAFANVQSLETHEGPYVFFEYVLSDEGILTLRSVAECLFADTTFTTSEALYGFVQTHLEHERLYLDEVLRFRKVDD